MICETLFTVAGFISTHIDAFPNDTNIIQLDIHEDYKEEARYYINAKVEGFVSFISDGKLFVMRMVR